MMVMMTVTKTSLALIVSAMLVGCGGASQPTSTSAASVVVRRPTSIASVVARAEAICMRKAAYVPVASPASSGGPSLTAIARERARTARELAALKVPAPFTTGYRRLASLIAQEANLYRRLVRYIDKGDNVGALTTERKIRERPVAKQALQVGLAKCA